MAPVTKTTSLNDMPAIIIADSKAIRMEEGNESDEEESIRSDSICTPESGDMGNVGPTAPNNQQNLIVIDQQDHGEHDTDNNDEDHHEEVTVSNRSNGSDDTSTLLLGPPAVTRHYCNYACIQYLLNCSK